VEETLITSMESCKVLIKLSLNLNKFYRVLASVSFSEFFYVAKVVIIERKMQKNRQSSLGRFG
jgi:hypothetical protein